MPGSPAGRARVFDGHGSAVLGAGVLVSPWHAVTACHVVIDANRFKLDFPDDPRQRRIEATVETAMPIGAQGEDDIAMLRLAEAADVASARLQDGVEGFEADVFGYPHGLDTGVWAAVRLRGSASAATDWYQIDRALGSAAIERGYSGSGVYDGHGAVIGIVIARMRMPEHVAAWMLPVRRWRELLPPGVIPASPLDRSPVPEVSFAHRMQLVTAMGRIPLMMDPEGRRLVARNLPEHIQLRIPTSAVVNLDLFGLLATVLDFDNGFAELYRVIAGLAGEGAHSVADLGRLARSLGLLDIREAG